MKARITVVTHGIAHGVTVVVTAVKTAAESKAQPWQAGERLHETRMFPWGMQLQARIAAEQWCAANGVKVSS